MGNRLRHIDQIRAIAVLCMVEVHTAAILPPQGITVGHPAAFFAAAFGGMAAPMFITLSGWGIYKSGMINANVIDKSDRQTISLLWNSPLDFLALLARCWLSRWLINDQRSFILRWVDN